MMCAATTATGQALPSPSSTSGIVHFANSGSPAAQGAFLEGLADLHNFEYDGAATQFQQAQKIDPSFAMAYWGEAMTYTHPVWAEQDRDKAVGALARLGASPQARIEKARTDREKDYMRAVEALYSEGDKASRDIAFADRMAELYTKYPDDVDAAAFYALALLGTAHEGRDFAIYMRAAAILEPLFPSNPNHPGVAHYLIHSYDDPIHAPLGLRAARAYSKIAPASAHAQHMCSHIFVAMGMWDDVVTANEAAIRIVNEFRARLGRGPAALGHIAAWLEYGYLQQGRVKEAKKMVSDAHALASKAASTQPRKAVLDPDNSADGSYAAMRSRYLFDTEDWSGEVLELRVPRGHAEVDITMDFADGYAAARTGKINDAKIALERVRRDKEALALTLKEQPERSYSGRIEVLEQQLAATIQEAQGQARQAVEALRAAATTEENLPFEFGPPFIEKPSYELMGEVLLRMNNAKDARAAFEKALARTPGRTTALAGLMHAAEKLGDGQKAAEIRARLQAIWHRADRPM